MTVCYEHISYKVDISSHYKYATYSTKIKWCFMVSYQKYEFIQLVYKYVCRLQYFRWHGNPISSRSWLLGFKWKQFLLMRKIIHGVYYISIKIDKRRDRCLILVSLICSVHSSITILLKFHKRISHLNSSCAKMSFVRGIKNFGIENNNRVKRLQTRYSFMERVTYGTALNIWN